MLDDGSARFADIVSIRYLSSSTASGRSSRSNERREAGVISAVRLAASATTEIIGTWGANERYDGPLFISHGEQDAVWGADRTQRLAKRLRAAGRRPEVHIYKGEGHVLRPEAQNTHYLRVVDFFGRALIDGSL